MKEVRDDRNTVVGYTIDRGAGVQEHKDSAFNTIGYTIDQDKQFEAAMESFNETAKAPSGWPSIEENGLFHCAIIYGYRVARFVFPIIFLFSKAFIIPAILCFLFMWPVEIYWHYVMKEYYNGPNAWRSLYKWDKLRAIYHFAGAAFLTLQTLGILFFNFF